MSATTTAYASKKSKYHLLMKSVKYYTHIIISQSSLKFSKKISFINIQETNTKKRKRGTNCVGMDADRNRLQTEKIHQVSCNTNSIRSR